MELGEEVVAALAWATATSCKETARSSGSALRRRKAEGGRRKGIWKAEVGRRKAELKAFDIRHSEFEIAIWQQFGGAVLFAAGFKL
jgi:hypothetical protein